MKSIKNLKKANDTFNVPLSQIYMMQQEAVAAEYVDVLQIPAFLCRQTDLLVAAARQVRPSM